MPAPVLTWRHSPWLATWQRMQGPLVSLPLPLARPPLPLGAVVRRSWGRRCWVLPLAAAAAEVQRQQLARVLPGSDR